MLVVHPKAQALILGIVLIAANGLFFYQRTLHVQDKALVWFPVLLALLYGWAWWSATKPRPTLRQVKRRVTPARSL